MKLVRTVYELRRAVHEARSSGKSIGFVPTMGALHEGHASLLRLSGKENGFSVLSIFVNPTQFGPKEDLEKYPRTLEEDCRIAEREGVDIVFAPPVEEMYSEGFQTFVELGEIARPLCGAYRPGHFRGVATVVNRLFNLVEPTRAYFGQKDVQQCLVLLRMVKDFGMDIELKICPTVREQDGLALSSRNRYLAPEEREQALVLYRALRAVREMRKGGEYSVDKLLAAGRRELDKIPAFQVQYFEIRSYPELAELGDAKQPCVAALAGFLGTTRLIDNFVFEE